MQKGQVAKRARDNEDALVEAIKRIDIPDASSAIENMEAALLKLTNVVERGFEQLIDALRPSPVAVPALLDVAAIGQALCEYVDSDMWYYGASTVSFPVIPNLVSVETEMRSWPHPPFMIMPRCQWNLLSEIDDELLADSIHNAGYSSVHDSTIMEIESLTKQPSACGKRINVAATILWRPHEKYLEKNPEVWRRLCCERAAASLMGMHRFRRCPMLAAMPRDVVQLLAQHVLATMGQKKWKIRYKWFM